ncbi:MAG: serine hydrolase domain-containing protein [Bacteroidota bacterium]
MRKGIPWNLLSLTIALFFRNCTALAVPQNYIDSNDSLSITASTDGWRKLLSHYTTDSIDSLLNVQVMQDHIAGAVVQIARGGVILYKKAYGFAQKFEDVNNCMVRLNDPEPMTTEKLFDLASLTKVFATTFGVMILVDRGEIRLDDPVHLYLKEFTGGKKSKVTIRQLLNHTSGLNEWQPIYYHARNKVEAYRYICRLPLKYEVGEARHYSDLGFMMLGYLIEKVSGEPLDVFLSKELYEPLGLKRTTFNPLRHGFSKSEIVATSHGNPFEYHMVADPNFAYKTNENVKAFAGWRHYTLRGEVNDGNAYYANGGVAGHAGLFSTASDLQVLTDLMLNKGSYNGKVFIEPDVVKEFVTEDEFGNGLGWDMNPEIIDSRGAPEGTYGHTGFTGTSVVIIPKYKLSILLLTNRQNVGVDKAGYYYNLNPVRQKLVDIVLREVRHTEEHMVK